MFVDNDLKITSTETRDIDGTNLSSPDRSVPTAELELTRRCVSDDRWPIASRRYHNTVQRSEGGRKFSDRRVGPREEGRKRRSNAAVRSVDRLRLWYKQLYSPIVWQQLIQQQQTKKERK